MKDCYICTDDGYKINRDGYTLCKQHYNEVEDVFKQNNCNHVWEYQPAEKDTNIHAYQFCIKCNKLDETDYEEEHE